MSQTASQGPALLFAGQGCQEPGMGRDVAEASPEAMELWKQAEKSSGLPLREIYWDGTAADMNDTRALQPALTVTHLNAWSQLAPRVRPSAAAGHSLGEFAALAAAGAISPRAAVEITALRGRLMAEADPSGEGAMAALLKMDEEQAARVVEEARGDRLLILANYNSPEQHVISGHKDAVADAVRAAKSAGGRGLRLQVSGAFHSPLMAEANERLRPALEKLEWRDPAFPVYGNVTAEPASTAASARQNILLQMISPVWWLQTIRNLYLAGVRWWLEVSPRAVLGRMVGPSLAAIGVDAGSLRVDLAGTLGQIMQIG